MKRSVCSAGLVSLILLVIASLPATPDSASAAPTSSGNCSVVSCRFYLPLVTKSPALLTPQFEVTQGVQQPNNSVLLVANRTTYVRWTLISNTAYGNVNANLYGTRGGISLSGSPLSALNNPRSLSATANRAVLDDTFNFQLPIDWTNGDVALSAQASNSTGFFISTASASFHFNPSVAMQVKVVPIAYYCTSGGTGTVTPAGPYDYLIDYTYRTYPVPSIGLTAHSAVAYSGPCTNGLPNPAGSDWSNILNVVTTVWQTEGSPNIYYYGLLNIYCGSSCIVGQGWISSYKAAVGFDGFGSSHTGASETHAHEVGHNHGREHAPFDPNDPTCGNPGNTDPAYPYLNGVIGDGAHPNFGFDIVSPMVFPDFYPYYDIMNYCETQWISDYTYSGIWKYDNIVLAQQTTPLIGNRSFLISGAIDPAAGRASFDPVYTLDTPAHQSERGDYALEMLNANQQVVASYSFAAATARPDRLSVPDQSEEIVGFHLALPYRDDITTLRVRRGSTVLGKLDAGTAAPQLKSVSSSLGISRSGQIEWSGSSLDGTPVSYLVQSSIDDGQTWETIAVNLDTPVITLSPSDFGGQVVRLQIVGSNGLKSSMLALGPYFVPEK